MPFHAAEAPDPSKLSAPDPSGHACAAVPDVPDAATRNELWNATGDKPVKVTVVVPDHWPEKDGSREPPHATTSRQSGRSRVFMGCEDTTLTRRA